jgi:hypothetical protein
MEVTVIDVNEDRRHAHPNEPWLWRSDWAEGRVLPFEQPGTITGSIAGFWAVAAVVLGTFWLIPRVDPPDEPFWPVGAVVWGLALLNGLFGFVALFLAVNRTRARSRCGDVWLALDSNPAILGDRLTASVRSSTPFSDGAQASLYLVCSLRAGTRAFVFKREAVARG